MNQQINPFYTSRIMKIKKFTQRHGVSRIAERITYYNPTKFSPYRYSFDNFSTIREIFQCVIP